MQSNRLPLYPKTYKADSRYLFMVIVGFLMATLFGFNLSTMQSLDTLFFILICLGLAFWGLYHTGCYIKLNDTSLSLRCMIGYERRVEYRQLIGVVESGRLGHSITLTYYPKFDSGLLDLESIHSLHLPAVSEQDTLFDYLQEKVPL